MHLHHQAHPHHYSGLRITISFIISKSIFHTSYFFYTLTNFPVLTAEYSLIQKISEYNKPYISLTMAFGIGLSGYSQYRIITEVLLPCQTEIVNVVNYNCGEIQQQPRFEAQLRSLLPQITSAFGANKSALVTIDELKKQQQSSEATVVEWANEALQGLGKGAPFSLYLMQNYFSKVASALGENDNQLSNRLCGMLKVCGQFWWTRIRIRSGTRQSKREVNQSEVEAFFEPLSPNVEELSV
ncbi:3-hydroxyisobutyryl-CoA hydrolase-like protein 3, mitochondrial [Pyrus communis]|uniref:3-hydroxyisobutyryl-CoA hydrolase-like protein 3, mitochondrial n=1 Tax=Pyrus communis TaxID=23211 RepID=UPI0035BF255D